MLATINPVQIAIKVTSFFCRYMAQNSGKERRNTTPYSRPLKVEGCAGDLSKGYILLWHAACNCVYVLLTQPAFIVVKTHNNGENGCDNHLRKYVFNMDVTII